MLRPPRDRRRERRRNDRVSPPDLKALAFWRAGRQLSDHGGTRQHCQLSPRLAEPPAWRRFFPAAWLPLLIKPGENNRSKRTLISSEAAGSPRHHMPSGPSVAPICHDPGDHCRHLAFCRANCSRSAWSRRSCHAARSDGRSILRVEKDRGKGWQSRRHPCARW
jgi:hypothetical protein